MNRLLTISALRRFAAGNNGSGCKLYIAAPMAGLVKPIASRSLDESFFMTMHHGSEISACKFARMMSTSGDQKNISEKLKDSGAVAEERDESSKSPSTKETFYLEDFPIRRSDLDMKLIFYDWCEYHDKIYETETEEKRRFAIFKDRVKFIEDINARNLGFRVPVDSDSDQSPEEFLPRKRWMKRVTS